LRTLRTCRLSLLCSAGEHGGALTRALIGTYQNWSDQGFPDGSGMVEGEVEIVIYRRLKRLGMRWLRANANAVVAVRVRTINSDWPAQPTLPNAAHLTGRLLVEPSDDRSVQPTALPRLWRPAEFITRR
jgi:hypothetical protein